MTGNFILRSYIKSACFCKQETAGILRTILVLILLAAASQSVYAQNRTFYVGSGLPDDNTHFATLEALRIATNPTGNNDYNLHDGDKIILYRNDNSLTAAFDMGTETTGAPTITVVSDNTAQQRVITPATTGNFPIFRMNVHDSIGSTLNMDGIILQDTTSSSGAIYAWWHNNLNITNSKFINNKNTGYGDSNGGAIYYWDAWDAYITDTDFIGNYTSAKGGAMLIWNSGTNRNTDTNVTLEVTEGKTMTFRDNYEQVTNMNDKTTGKKNSINFTGSSGKHINLNIITAKNGILDMQDPFATNAASGGSNPYTVDITKTGTGIWRLSGISRVEGSGGTNVLIEEGTLELTTGAQLLTIGTNDSFTIKKGAETFLRGNNAIEGTKVVFEPDSYLTFDMDFYKTNAKSKPMLALSGTTLEIKGTTVSIENLPEQGDPSRNGEYLLIRGDSSLEAGDFNLFIGSEKVDISGEVSPRFGYSLGNTANEKELVLRVQDKENAIIKWQNNSNENYRDKWSVFGKNWTRPYHNNESDGFVPGDTVVFDGMSGEQIITVFSDVRGSAVIAPVEDGGYTFYKDNGIGMHVAGAADWKFTGSKISDGYDPALAGDASNDVKKAALYYTGSGSLRLENNEVNEFHGNVIHAGTGTIYVSQPDRFGQGDAFEFWNNSTATDTSKVVFIETQTFDKQYKSINSGNGYVTNEGGITLTLTSAGDTIADVDGGKLTFKGTSCDNFLVKNNQNKSINVKNGGEFIANEITISGNSSATGLIIAQNSNLTVKDSDLIGNTAQAVIVFGTTSGTDTLLLTAGDGKELNIADNSSPSPYGAGIALSASGGSTTNVNINAEKTGIVNILNPFAGQVNDVSSSIVINKTGTGTANIGGINTFTNNAGGTLSLTVSEGILALEKNAALTLPKGIVTVKDGSGLLSKGGNKITSETFTLQNNSTLAFDLKDLTGETPDEKLLDIQATVAAITGKANVNLINVELNRLEDGDVRTFNLAYFKNGFTEAGLDKLTLQYNGTDMNLLRQNFAELTYDKSGDNILAVNISAPHNGLTQWNNNSTTKIWNQVDANWNGTNRAKYDLTGTTQFLDGDAVEFIGADGTQTITVYENGVSIADRPTAVGSGTVAGMTVNNNAGQNYIFTGGAIKGDGLLVKKGTGDLTFEQSNTFTGKTMIENGKIIAKKTDSLGTEGGVEIQNNGTLNFANTENGNFTQVITGSGNILKTDTGIVILTEASPDFTGSVNIQKGELGIADIKGIGTAAVNTGDEDSSGTFAFAGAKGTFNSEISGEGKVRVGSNSGGTGADVEMSGTKTYTGGTTIDKDSTLTIKQFENTGTGNIAVNGTLKLQFADNKTLDNRNITGTGLIEKNLAGQLKFNTATDFSGIFRLNDGSIRLTNGYGLQNATLEHKGGDIDFSNNSAVIFGGLAGGTDNSGKRLGILLENNDSRKITLSVGNNNTDQTYSGELSGIGKFVKIGTGTQILNGINSYTGGTLVSSGRLVGTDAGSFGTDLIENNSELEFRIGNGKSQTYNSILAGTGTLIKGGTGELTLTEQNTYTGGTRVEGGILTVKTLQSLGMNIKSETALPPSAGNVVINDGAVLAVNIDTATTSAADTSITKNVSGNGTLRKTGNGVLSLDTDITLNGKIDVQNGTFYLNGNTAAAVDVRSGATLSGVGTSDNLVHFYNGASHKINNRNNDVLGVFKADNIQYDNGSTIYIKIGPHGSDKVVAENQLNFAANGGSVNVRLINLGLTEPDDVSGSSRYEIFNSEKGLIFLDGSVLADGASGGKDITAAGTNASIQLIGEGINVIGYNVAKTNGKDKSIFVDVLFDGIFDPSLNSNQISTLLDVGSSTVLDEVFSRTGEARKGLLNELMPMVQTAMPYINNRSITHFNEGVFNRLRFLREPVYQPVFKDETAFLPSPAPLYRGAPKVNKRSLWAQNYGDVVLMQADALRPEFRINSYGFNVGSDSPITRCSTFGFGMGGNFANVAVNQFGQRADIDSFLIAAYGDWFNEYGWMLTGSAGVVVNQSEAKRSVYSLDTKIDSTHNGTSFFGSLEGSKKFRFACFDVSPFAGIDLIWLSEERYNERLVYGDPNLPLCVAKNATNSILSTAGLRVGRTFRLLGGNIVSPTAYLAWVHNYNVGDVKTWSWFPGQDGFSITGASMYRDRAKVGTNLDMTLNNRLSMYTRFDAELSHHLQDLSIQWGIQLGF